MCGNVHTCWSRCVYRLDQQRAVTLLPVYGGIESVGRWPPSLHTTALLSQQRQHAHTCTALTEEKESKLRQAGLTDMMTKCVQAATGKRSQIFCYCNLQNHVKHGYLGPPTVGLLSINNLCFAISNDQLHVYLQKLIQQSHLQTHSDSSLGSFLKKKKLKSCVKIILFKLG